MCVTSPAQAPATKAQAQQCSADPARLVGGWRCTRKLNELSTNGKQAKRKTGERSSQEDGGEGGVHGLCIQVIRCRRCDAMEKYPCAGKLTAKPFDLGKIARLLSLRRFLLQGKLVLQRPRKRLCTAAQNHHDKDTDGISGEKDQRVASLYFVGEINAKVTSVFVMISIA